MVIRSIPWKALPLWIAIVMGLAALGSVLISEIRVRGVSGVLAPAASDGDLVLTGFRLVTVTNGVTEWDITASRARLFEKRHEALLDDGKGAARTRDGSRVEFEGTSGAFDTATQDATIEGPQGGTGVRLPGGHGLPAAASAPAAEAPSMPGHPEGRMAISSRSMTVKNLDRRISFDRAVVVKKGDMDL